MGQGQHLSDRQIETLRLAYAETGNQRESARRAGCSPSSAKRYVAGCLDELAQLRTAKAIDIIEEIARVRLALLTAMDRPEKLAKASITELATSFGILVDKHQLLTNHPTARTETIASDPAARLSADDLEQLAALREKLAVS